MTQTELIDGVFCLRHGGDIEVISCYRDHTWTERCVDCFLNEVIAQGGDLGHVQQHTELSNSELESCLN